MYIFVSKLISDLIKSWYQVEIEKILQSRPINPNLAHQVILLIGLTSHVFRAKLLASFCEPEIYQMKPKKVMENVREGLLWGKEA